VDDRPFVGGDGVNAQAQGRAQIIGGGLAGVRVHRGVLEEHIGLAGLEPLGQRVHVGEGRLALGGEGAQVAMQQLLGAVAAGVGVPAQPPRRHAGEGELGVVLLAQFGALAVEELHQGAADVAEAQEGEVVMGHAGEVS
jgi:hypothetical protein